MRCLIIPKIHDKDGVPAKYHHEGYKADISLVDIPISDYDSLLSAMSAVFYYGTADLGHKVLTSYGLDLCRCGYSYVSDWLTPEEYFRVAKYHSFGSMLLNSVYGRHAMYADTDSVIVSGGDENDD